MAALPIGFSLERPVMLILPATPLRHRPHVNHIGRYSPSFGVSRALPTRKETTSTMSSGMPLLAIVALPFIGSLVAIFLRQDARNGAAFLAGSVALCATVLTALQYRAVGHGGVLRVGIEWVPSLGLDFTLRMDGFAWMFAVLVTGIGFLVVLYARYYMSPDDPVPRFFAFLLAFMGAMLGIVLSGNLIQLVFFWELTSLFSFLLIGYWHHNAGARDGARMALTVTGAGGLCLLAGVLLLGHIVGSYDLDRGARRRRPRSARIALYLPALVLVLLGALPRARSSRSTSGCRTRWRRRRRSRPTCTRRPW